MDEKPKPLSFSNGGAALRKHQPPHLQHHLRPPDAALYRECLKNHAASLGGHAVDGCGEFMPSPSANPADPSSLTCAACGCHRNFHRRFLGADEDEDAPGGGESSEDEDDDEVGEHGGGAHHMLLALSTGGGMGRDPGARAAEPPRKRFRTKFTAAQKERMQELAERMGWRMQKRDEAMVEEWCRGIEVEKGVFKVWMHNNKHAFVGGSGRRGDLSAIAAAAASTGSGGGQEGGGNERNGREGSGGGGGDGGGANHVGNGSSGSS